MSSNSSKVAAVQLKEGGEEEGFWKLENLSLTHAVEGKINCEFITFS